MSQPTTHPNLSVTLTIGKASYPVTSYTVDCEHEWDDTKSTYIYGEPTLDVTVDRPTFLAIVHQSPLTVDTMQQENYQGERTGTLIITPLPGVTVRYNYPRKADVKCPKCNELVYSDQLCSEWDSARIVMGSGYGRLCEACWQEYNAANAANSTMASASSPVQSRECAQCGKHTHTVGDGLEHITDAGNVLCELCFNNPSLRSIS